MVPQSPQEQIFHFFCATVSNSTTVGILPDVLPFDHDHKYMYEGINAEKILSHFCSYVSDFYNYLQGGQSFDILKRPQNFDKLARFFFQIMLPEYLNYNIPVGFNQYLLTRPFEMTKNSQIEGKYSSLSTYVLRFAYPLAQ